MTIKHPSDYIDQKLLATISQQAFEAEQQQQLTQEQLHIISRQRWFNLFVPKKWGGLQLSLLQGLQIEEALAYADGSTGWTVTLCSGANWFAGFLPVAAAAGIFKNERVCFACSGKPSGIAEITPEGYLISVSWRFATGAPYATIFTANCEVHKNGVPLTYGDGNRVIASFWFLKEEVTIINDWNYFGMKATASNKFIIQNVVVPEERRFDISPGAATNSHTIYQYPFLQFAEATLAVNFSGMALRFTDVCGEAVKSWQPGKYKEERSLMALASKINKAKALMDQKRQCVYENVEASWQQLKNQRYLQPPLQNSLSNACRSLAITARKIVEDIYPCMGMEAADPSTEMNRIWRNIHTASQHSLLNFPLPEME